MDLMNLNDPHTQNQKTPFFKNDDPFENAERQRLVVVARRQGLEAAKRYFGLQSEATKAAAMESEAAKLYLEQLRSGWGAPLVSVGGATLYEFGIVLPGYSGSLRGFSASSNQTGQIQHVSHVTSKTTSGAGCAALGCLFAGPVGAVAGATMGKKNDVRTDVQVVDNRIFEIQVMGPGVAWSHVGNYTIEHSIRSFRDLLHARSTNQDDPRVLAASQERVFVTKSQLAEVEFKKLEEKDERLRSAQYAYEMAWTDFESVRLSVPRDLLSRWRAASLGVKVASIFFGPLLLAAWIGLLVLGGNPQIAPIVPLAVIVGLIQLIVIATLAVYYRIEYRLLKTLPSESPNLASVMRFFSRFQR